jgi:hypothetical protein
MRLTWTISSFPFDPSKYHAVVETIGDVTVTVDGVVFVAFKDLLILEFAFCINAWLAPGDQTHDRGFYYKSMDEEEEPLLALAPATAESYVASSCWAVSTPRPLERREIVTAFTSYLSELEEALARDHRFRLAQAFETFKA